MKIAFLSHLDLNLYLFRLPIMQRLVDKGHKVYAVCPRGDKFDLFAQYGIEAIGYHIERSSLNPVKEIMTICHIYKVLKPLELDVVHTFTAKPNIYGTFAAKAAGIPVVISLVEGLGSFYIEDSFKNRVVRNIIEKLYEIVFSSSDRVIFVNNDDPVYLISKGVVKEDKITIIKSVGIDTKIYDPKSVDHQKIADLRADLNLGDKIVVLMVARAIWHKGIREFYEAAKKLSRLARVKFVLVGDIDQGNPSSADRDFLSSGKVLWLGHRDDIVELTAMSDIYVLPSYREGVPRTLLEAASMAKPIVTTDTVGCREVVRDGYNGYLVPVRDVYALAEKIEELATNRQKRKIMGENGRIMATDAFDTEIVAGQYMDLYHQLLKQKGI